MRLVPAEERPWFAPLFRGCAARCCSVRSCLEEGRGSLYVAAGGTCGLVAHGARFLGGLTDRWTGAALRRLVPVGAMVFPCGAGLPASLVLIDGEHYLFERIETSEAALRAQAAMLPPGFHLQRVDAAVAARAVRAFGRDAIGLFRNTDDFLAAGLGVCVAEGRRVVSIATSLIRSGDRMELSVFTRPAYRRQGLARAAAASLVLACRTRHLQPVWHAMSPESRQLAAQLGFRDAVPLRAYLRIM